MSMHHLIPDFKSVLLIDNDIDDRATVCQLLSEIDEKICVCEADTAEQGIDYFQNESFDCVFLDYRLPDLTSLEALQRLLKINESHAVIIVLTGQNNEQLAIELMEAGATDYLDKNALKSDILMRALRYATARQQFQKEASKEVRALLKKQQYIATHDALTGLANRLLLTDRINSALMHQARQETSLALLFLDLDGFKQINDTLGHTVGDELLVKISMVLSQIIRESDTLARLGGDEFVILLTNIKRAEDVAKVADNILKALANPFELHSQKHYMSASIGISVCPSDGRDFETLLKHADLTMYMAKAQGKNNYQFFNYALNKKAEEKLCLIHDLRNAIENKEFVVYFQPKINTKTLAIVGAEALIRWEHPTKGLIYPNDFIPIAEESGLINQVGEQMMSEAIDRFMRFPVEKEGDFHLALNVSVEQFNKSCFVTHLCELVDLYHIPPVCIELEITESIFIHNYQHVVSLLHYLKGMGFRICMDDFGTGYSCLKYLRELPLDGLKIDKSFIIYALENNKDLEIVRAIIALAHHLNIAVVAEGVEKIEHLEFLRGEGCELVQGYLFSKPIGEEAFIDFYKKGIEL